jgi:Na+-driven multidrug efflux pump
MVAGLGDVKMSGMSVAGQILFVFMVLSNAICAAGGIYMTLLKLTDIVKIIVAHLWLKKEKWVKNLTAQAT